jgi:hypothetical protein
VHFFSGVDQQVANPETMSNAELLKELAADASLLMKRQIALAKVEAKQQLQREKHVAEALGTAGLLAYAGVILLLVSAGIAVGEAIGALWAGPLIIGAVVLVAAGVTFMVGWAKRVKRPLPRTRDRVEKSE